MVRKRILRYFFSLNFLLFSCKEYNPSGEKKACGYAWKMVAFEEDMRNNYEKVPPFVYKVQWEIGNVQGMKNEISEWSKGQLLVQKNGYFSGFFCVLSQFHKGDSIHLFIPASDFYRDFFGVVPHDYGREDTLELRFRILNEMYERTWKTYSDSILKEKERKRKEFIERMGYFTDSSGIGSDQILRSMLYSPDKEIRVTYGCRNLNGKLLDTTLHFVYVRYRDLENKIFIGGLNYVIKRISCPDTVKFVLPSHMAFGEKGFYNIIPPHEPLVYHLIILPHNE